MPSTIPIQDIRNNPARINTPQSKIFEIYSVFGYFILPESQYMSKSGQIVSQLYTINPLMDSHENTNEYQFNDIFEYNNNIFEYNIVPKNLIKNFQQMPKTFPATISNNTGSQIQNEAVYAITIQHHCIEYVLYALQSSLPNKNANYQSW